MRALDDVHIANAARRWLGTPYRHQASCLGHGADCLGVIRGVWREVVGEEPQALPPYARDWARGGDAGALGEAAARWLERETGPQDPPPPGRVLLFRLARQGPITHCGIMVEGGRFVHAYQDRAVTLSRFGRYWQARLAGVFRFPLTEG